MKQLSNGLRFTGDRLVPGSKILKPLRVENIARFRFFREYTQGIYVLDMGCGTGEGTIYLAKQSDARVIGVDISCGALQVAYRENYEKHAEFAQMDVEKLAFANQSFDTIVSVEVIEHIDNPMAYLSESYRVLRENGTFMLTTPNKIRSSPNPGSLWPAHLREYTPDQLSELLTKVYTEVELWGEYIPIYENHPIRKLFRKLGPIIKPILPHWIRIRALPMLQTAIKSDLQIEDVVFTKNNIQDLATIIAICKK